MTTYDDLSAVFINTTFKARNLMHMPRMLKDAGGIGAHGDQKTAWDKGERFDHPNPEYR